MGKGSWVTYCTTVFDDIWILIPPYTPGWITSLIFCQFTITKVLSQLKGQGYGVERHFQQNVIYLVGVSFIDEGTGVREKTIDLPHVTDKLDHIMLY